MKPTDIPKDEYSAYYGTYINKAPELTLVEALIESSNDFLNFIEHIPEDKLEYRYEASKWTIKEILQHLIDSEKVFNYRAMRFARADKTALPGYDHNEYVGPSQANKRSMSSLIEEYKSQRQNTIIFFKNLSDEMLIRSGMANDNNLSVRAIAFLQCGHALHHAEVIRERYLS